MEKNTDALYVQPKTTRGQQRVDLILEAAADLIVEEGVDALTTNAVAKRAQTSIGSLYQFFPNKESIMVALGDRYRCALQTILDNALEMASTSSDFSEQLECIVENVIQFEVNNLAFGLICQPTTGVPADSLVKEVTFRLVDLLSMWVPEMSTDEKSLHAEVCIRVMAALLPITHVDSQIRPEGVRELKNVLRNYLTPLVARD